MIVALITALALSSPTAGQPASSSAVSSATPIREVVYKVSFTRRLSVQNETYGGSISNNENATSSAPAFAEAGSNASDNGTVTIDVMQATDTALGIRVTERWDGSTPSATYLGNVTSDGAVNFGGGQMNECTSAILEYFGPAVMDGQPANAGVSWERVAKGANADVDTVYSVGAIDGSVANIHEQSTVKSKTISLTDTVVTTDVKYKPATLVPVSGQVVMHASRSSASSVTNISTIAHFDRVSDTYDKGQ